MQSCNSYILRTTQSSAAPKIPAAARTAGATIPVGILAPPVLELVPVAVGTGRDISLATTVLKPSRKLFSYDCTAPANGNGDTMALMLEM